MLQHWRAKSIISGDTHHQKRLKYTIYQWKAMVLENTDMVGVKKYFVNILVKVKVKGQGQNAKNKS